MSSTLKTNAIEPEGATTELVVGKSGQTVTVGGSGGLKTNTFKDAGGNTLFTSNGSGTLSSVSGFGGAQVLISSQTASNSASISFTSGLTSTYKEYVFEFFNINPATDNAGISFQVNAVGGSGFNETMTTTFFNAAHRENDTTTTLNYVASEDQAQGTAYQKLVYGTGNDADSSASGELHLFNPASTTYVKHFYSRFNEMYNAELTGDRYAAGYINITAAIDEISFKMTSGNFDGKIKMYGIK